MKQDFSELIEYLDKRFTKIDKKIDRLENKFDKKFDKLVTAIDKLTKSLEIYHDEQKAISAKMDIHEKWIKQIARKVGLELKS